MTNADTRIETYIPLYRKYRPQSFADVVGQEAIVQTLGNAIQLNKVAHAYLLCGPRGTGKTSTARIFAKSLNCEQGPTVSPCLQCASCVGITQGNALDVIEFDAASNNGVGDARELIENCQYSSMTGRFKVYIIDEVHMLTPQAFNALLKTLEEPPPNVIFIFATTEGHKVLPTIISRCQRFDFNRITTDSIVQRLRHIASQENITIEDEALLMIARHARGGLRDAVGLLDQVAVLGRANPGQSIGRKDVALFIGTLEEELLLRLSHAMADRRAADLLNDLTELMHRGIEPIQLLKDLTLHFRNLLLVQAAGPQTDPDTLSLPPDYFNALAEQARLFPEPEELPQIIGRLASVERNIRNSTQPQLWLEVGLIELAYRAEIYQIKTLSERITRLEAQLSGQAPLSPPQANAPSSHPPTAQAVPTVGAILQQAAPQATMPPAAPAVNAVPSPTMPPSSAAPALTMQPSTNPSPVPPAQVTMPVAAQSAPSQPAPSPNASGGSLGNLEAEYRQICTSMPSLTLRSLLQQQAFPIQLTNDVLLIGVISEPNLTVLKKPDRFIHLQKSVDKFYGRPIRIDLVHEKNRPSGSATSYAEPSGATPKPAMTAQAAPSSTNAFPMGGNPTSATGHAAAHGPESRPPAMPLFPQEGQEAAAPSPQSATATLTHPSTEEALASSSNSQMSTGHPLGLAPQPAADNFSPPAVAVSQPSTTVDGGERTTRAAAMPSLPAREEKRIDFSKKPSSTSAAPPMDSDAPPMDFGDPPPDLDDDDDFSPPSMGARSATSQNNEPDDQVDNDTQVLLTSGTADPELLESKKHALELLQGKVVE